MAVACGLRASVGGCSCAAGMTAGAAAGAGAGAGADAGADADAAGVVCAAGWADDVGAGLGLPPPLEQAAMVRTRHGVSLRMRASYCACGRVARVSAVLAAPPWSGRARCRTGSRR